MSRLRYAVHGLDVGVSTNDTDVADAIARRLTYFAGPAGPVDVDFRIRVVADEDSHAVGPPPPGARPVYEPPAGELVYAEAEDALYLDYEGRARFAYRPDRATVDVSAIAAEPGRSWLLSRPLFTIPLLEIAKRHGLYGVHAGAVATGGSSILLPGGTGSGKSTLTVALVRAGRDLLADDIVFLRTENGLEALAFPDETDLTPVTASWFPELEHLAGRELAPGWPKHRVRLEEALGARIAPTTRPAAVVFPHISHEDRSELSPLGVDEALLELVPNVLLTEAASSQAHLDALGTLARETPCFRLAAGRDFDRIALLLADLAA